MSSNEQTPPSGIPSLQQLLHRYQANPPHALLLTSRRFSSSSNAEGTDSRSNSDEPLKASDSHLASDLLATEVNAIARSLCGFSFDLKDHEAHRQVAAKLKHTDYMCISGSRRTLRREDIEPLFERLRYSPQLGTRRLVIIERAQRLTPHAANALLKSIEEPTIQVVFILTSPSVSHILPTIASRCMRLHVPPVASGEDEDSESSRSATGDTSPFDSSERAFLQRIVAALASSPVSNILGSSQSPLNTSEQFSEDLETLEVIGKEHRADEIIEELIRLSVQQRVRWNKDSQRPEMHNHSLGWLTSKLRSWQRAKEYNPSSALRLCELVLAGQKGLQSQTRAAAANHRSTTNKPARG